MCAKMWMSFRGDFWKKKNSRLTWKHGELSLRFAPVDCPQPATAAPPLRKVNHHMKKGFFVLLLFWYFAMLYFGGSYMLFPGSKRYRPCFSFEVDRSCATAHPIINIPESIYKVTTHSLLLYSCLCLTFPWLKGNLRRPVYFISNFPRPPFNRSFQGSRNNAIMEKQGKWVGGA